MAIFNSYVKLPEGKANPDLLHCPIPVADCSPEEVWRKQGILAEKDPELMHFWCNIHIFLTSKISDIT